MAPGPDWLPAIDTEAAADAIGDGIQALVDSGILQTTAGVATADPTVLVGGAVVGTLAKTELVEYSRIADRRLTQYIEETDEDEHAYRVKLAKGISHFLPGGFGDAAIDAARGNPDDLREVMEEYYAGEKHDELDNAVQRILKGDIENLGTELCEAFDTDDVYEAQALFLDFRDLIESRQVQETLETVLDIEGRFADLEEELGETRKELRANFRALVRRDLRDEGFVYVAPVEFDREITDSEAAWRAGFDLVHVRQGFAAPRAGIHGDRTVREELLSTLRDGDDQLIVGRAGSGKSTVCKSVACAWYDDPDTGTVFYRESGKGRPFTSWGSLVKAVRESDGHTLVAVEDAARDETEAVYEAMADLRGDRVSFLLDARRGDVERFGEPGQFETGAQGKVAEAYRRIPRYSLAEGLSKAEIRAVFDRFEATTGREVGAPPDRIRDELQQGGDIGQMLFLSYYLPVGGGGGGLLRDVANKYQTITGTADGREHWTDVTEFDADLRQDVALTTALLVATGVGNHDELAHALCEKHGRDEAVHHEITEIRTALEGWFVYPTDDPDAEVPATTHELWATLYLQQEAEAFVENQEQREREFGTPDPNRFHTCLTALYAVVDDSCREYLLRDGYPDSTVLKRIEDDPAAFGERLAVDILDLGRDRPALTPLFEFGTDLEMPVPSNCDLDAVSRIETRKGHVCLDRGAYDQARVHYRRSLDINRELGDRQGEANSLGNLGVVAQSQGDYDDAREYHQQSLDIKRELGDRQGEANSLTGLGNVARNQGDYDDAREYHQQSLDIKRELGDRQAEANSLGNLGAVAQSQGDYDDAREYHQQSLDLDRELGDRQGEAQSLTGLGTVAQSQGDYDDAREYHHQSLDLARELGDRQGEANSLGNLGAVAQSQGDYDDAREYHQQSLDIKRELGDRQGEAKSLTGLGNVARNQGDYDDAREYHQQSLNIKRELGDRQGEATSLNNLGLVARNQGDYDDAREYHHQSLDLARELGDRQGEANSLNNLGNVAQSQGDYDDAREYFQQSLDLYRELGDRQGEAKSLTGLGNVARNQGDYDDAREYHHQSLDLARELGDRQGEANSLNNLGNVAQSQGDYDDAREYFQQSLDIKRELGDRQGEAKSLTGLGNVARNQGDYDDAREYYQQSLDLDRELGDRQGEAKSLAGLGLVAQSQGDYDDAREYHHQSLDLARELGDRQGEANSLGNLGLVARNQGDYDDARDYLQQSLDLARELGDRQGEAQSLTGLGTVAQSQGDYDDAREYFRRANEQFREIGSFRNALTTFKTLVDVCEEMDDTEAAIEWCERARDWAGSVDRIDLSDTAAEFERRRLRLDVSEEATWELYLNGVYHVYSGDDEAAFRLLEEVWDRRETFGADTDVSPVIVSAGVVLAAYARLFDDEASPYDAGEMLNAIDEEQELTLGAGVLSERLAEGETETTPDELEATADEQDSEFAQLDLLAAARLLKSLDAE